MTMKGPLTTVAILAIAFNFSNLAYADSETVSTSSSLSSANIAAASTKVSKDIYINAKYNFNIHKEQLRQVVGAAENGDIYAQRHLGIIYQNGYGVTKSDVVALMWYTISTKNGFKEAKTNIDATEIYMASDQVMLAQRMARLWINKH